MKNISFLYVILDLGSFFQDPKIRSVWPSSVVRWSGRRPSIAVGVPRGRRECVPRGRSYFSRRTNFYMVRELVVRTPCRATRSFVRSGVRFPGPFVCLQAHGICGLCQMEHIYGKIAPTTGAIPIAITPTQETPDKAPIPTPTPIPEIPVQGKALEGKSKARKTKETPMSHQ